ncbi:hypothetical protein C922_02560 [Plasmodium inui San Antonio 1]|uniref:Ubiquitin-like domain-containing protein n=1 Tax=Plasmodium inui San Antonio 1 TaxID=1237626 RepID=W7ANQ4_9APIC|nr:hypothetical protein C922_02560 [Plasmodium inui San Antonio 1]EUD66976.1 hypothetical protein C922_02560 [Plasmodium inui San Antonio 1]
MVWKSDCWNAAICLCCFVLVSICSGVKLSRYQYGRPPKRSCLMDVSVSGMSRRLSKGCRSADKCSPADKHNFASQDNPPASRPPADRWNVLISCYDQWDAFRNSFLLTVHEKQCVRDIKQQIERAHGIPASFQQILYQTKPLNDDLPIGQLTKGIKMHLINLTLVTILPHIFPSQYKKLLHHLEKHNYVVSEEDIAHSFSEFDKGFPKMVQAKGINLDKIKKEIEELQHVDKKKLLLRLGVDFPLMSDMLLDRLKELFNFYYLGDIKSVVKFSLFFFILYKVLFPGLTNILSASYQQILMCQ